jgi:hypothetical protein
MTMRQDDEIDLLRRNPILIHLIKEIRNMTGMTRIDENRYFSSDQISIAIILIRILPQIGIEILFQLHSLSYETLLINPRSCVKTKIY